MSELNNAVEIATLKGMLTEIKGSLDRAEPTRSTMQAGINELKEEIIRLTGRMNNLEKSFTEAKPTIVEFVAFKERAKGAGMAGKAAWMLAGFTLSFLAWAMGILDKIGK